MGLTAAIPARIPAEFFNSLGLFPYTKSGYPLALKLTTEPIIWLWQLDACVWGENGNPARRQ